MLRSGKWWRTLPVIVGVLVPHWVQADSRTPLEIANRGPLVAIYGLPMAQGGALLERGQQQWQLAFSLANTFRIPAGESEAIYWDGETSTARLGWKLGVGKRFELGLELPVVHHGGGFMDSMIDNYHRAFGFDRSHRNEVPYDQLHYQANKDGQVEFRVAESGTGLGDVQGKLGYQILASEQRWLAARFTLKAPTGDAEQLYGSGGWDSSAALHWADQHALAAYNISYELSGGALYTSDGDVLSDRRRNVVAFGSALLAWQVRPWVNLKLQLDGHTAFYYSEMRELNSSSVQLSLGGSFSLAQRWELDLAFTEDLVVDTAPDVSLLLALRLRY